MKPTSKNQVCNISIGTILKGKWHQNTYKVIKPLGYGATGVVYLANSTHGYVALKVSENSMAITSEVNVLRHFSKVQEYTLGPSLLDVDDWLHPQYQVTVPFYVMEYLEGQDLLQFIQRRGEEWLGILIVQLLTDLQRLHQSGWIFGDLKPDNLLVTSSPPRIRWLDVGGTTVQGRSIKEFTEFFDRGYWGLGSRKAEPSYDLFAVAMIIINTAFPKRFAKKGEGVTQLKQAIDSRPPLRKYGSILIKALNGHYKEANEMKGEILEVISHENDRAQSKAFHIRREQLPVKKTRKIGGVIETILIAVFLLLGYCLYLFGQLF